MSSEDLGWQTNIHGAEEYEARGNWKGGGLLWSDTEASSWFTNTNHKKNSNYCV
jgi:hypothetical protein